MNERIDAGKYFQVDKWSNLKHAAMRLAMDHIRYAGRDIDGKLIHRIATRWTLGDAISFYSSHQTLWFNS